MKRIATLAAVASLAGCAMTPAQVLDTESMASATLKTDIAGLVPCLQNEMGNLVGSWTASQITDRDGKTATVRLHGPADTGTIVVAKAKRIGETTQLSVHVSTSTMPRQRLADIVMKLAEGCDTR
jgi:hypothetical protein